VLQNPLRAAFAPVLCVQAMAQSPSPRGTSRDEVWLLTTPKHQSDAKIELQALDDADAHQTPNVLPACSSPTKQETPQVNWVDLANQLRGADAHDGHKPLSCGTPQPICAWSHIVSPTLEGEEPLSPLSPKGSRKKWRQRSRPSTVLQAPHATWDDMMSSSRADSQKSFHLWLHTPPPSLTQTGEDGSLSLCLPAPWGMPLCEPTPPPPAASMQAMEATQAPAAMAAEEDKLSGPLPYSSPKRGPDSMFFTPPFSGFCASPSPMPALLAMTSPKPALPSAVDLLRTPTPCKADGGPRTRPICKGSAFLGTSPSRNAGNGFDTPPPRKSFGSPLPSTAADGLGMVLTRKADDSFGTPPPRKRFASPPPAPSPARSYGFQGGEDCFYTPQLSDMEGAALSSPLDINWPPPPAQGMSPTPLLTPSPMSALLNACQEDDNSDCGRFAREFCEVTQLCDGRFCTTFRARHKIDQQLYAVKAQTVLHDEQEAEVQDVATLAALIAEGPGCSNLVRYFSAWLEDNLLYVQTELCECSLRDHIASRRTARKWEALPMQEVPAQKLDEYMSFTEKELTAVLRDVAAGLAALHRHDIAHLDLSPDTIFMQNGSFKISGLGLAARLQRSMEDANGDRATASAAAADHRYMALELLEGTRVNLLKADVFSLGLVCYELERSPATLPYDGAEWRDLRRGCLKFGAVQPMSKMLVLLLCSMVSPDPSKRPDSTEIVGQLQDGRVQGMLHAVACEAPREGATDMIPTQRGEAPKDEDMQELRAARAALQQAEEEAERSRQRAFHYLQEIQRMRGQHGLNQQLCSSELGSALRTASCPMKRPRFRATGV